MNFNGFIKQSKTEYRDLIAGKTPVIMIGAATCGNSAGAQTIKATMEEELEKNHAEFKMVEVGCIGLCYAEPIITIIKKGNPAIFYRQVTPKIATELVNSYILGDDPLLEYAIGTVDINQFKEGIEEERSDKVFSAEGSGENDFDETSTESIFDAVLNLFDLPVLKPQVRRILRNCGFTDPTNIKHYLAKDGYTGFQIGRAHV